METTEGPCKPMMKKEKSEEGSRVTQQYEIDEQSGKLLKLIEIWPLLKEDGKHNNAENDEEV